MSIAQTTSSATISFRSSERASGGWFYSGMAIAAILTSVAGFAPSLISTAGRNAPVTPVAAAHGMISFAWLLVFLTQTILIRTGRITAHRSLGTASAVLAAAVITLGYVTSIAMARRGFDLSGDLAVRPDPLASLGFPLLDTLMFAVLFIVGVMYRRRPGIHKGLMLLAVAAALMPAPLAHLIGHYPFLRNLGPLAPIPIYAFLFAGAIYDRIALRRFHPVTLGGALGIFIIEALCNTMIFPGEVWHRFAAWLVH